MKKSSILLLVLFIFHHITIAGGGGGGGGCTPSDNSGSPTSVSAGTTYSYDNSGCTASTDCASPYNICNTPGFSSNNGDCYALIMGATCSIYGCFCGSPENTSFAQFCPTTTGTYTFSVSNISCSGGGASLQWGLYEAGATCDSGSDMFFCSGGTTANQSNSVSLTAGTCYRIVFDGNAGADCTWNFLITAPLPLEMLCFEAEGKDANIDLKWSVASEIGTLSYTVERSVNGRDFNAIGTINSIQDSPTEKTYTYRDNISGINTPNLYYRLKRTDKNGSESYSAVIVTENSNLIEVNVYPNLFSEGTLVNVMIDKENAASASIRVFSVRGEDVTRKISTVNDDNGNYQLDFNSLNTGTYIVSVVNGNRRVSKTVVKY